MREARTGSSGQSSARSITACASTSMHVALESNLQSPRGVHTAVTTIRPLVAPRTFRTVATLRTPIGPCRATPRSVLTVNSSAPMTVATEGE